MPHTESALVAPRVEQGVSTQPAQYSTNEHVLKNAATARRAALSPATATLQVGMAGSTGVTARL